MKETALQKQEIKVETPKCMWAYKDCGYARELFECEAPQEKLLFCVNCQLAEAGHRLEKLDEKVAALLEAGKE
ncbi:MAG: hypothetical protein AB1485_00165 [Candidatus Thermoplasmatota archaeon]